jgi:hypothetical protein
MPRLALPLLALLVGCSEYTLDAKDGDPGAPDDTGSAAVADSGGTRGGDTAAEGGSTLPGDTASPDSGAPGSGPPDTSVPDTGLPDTGFPDTGGGDDLCSLAARTAGYLDAFQVPGDGQVLFCHRESGPHFVEINTNISACIPHLDHTHDVFPTTLCDS